MKAFHDVHAHNYLSACSHDNLATAEAYVNKAAELGLKVLGFANHTWDETVPGASPWYHDQSIAFQMQIKTQAGIGSMVHGLGRIRRMTDKCGLMIKSFNIPLI